MARSGSASGEVAVPSYGGWVLTKKIGRSLGRFARRKPLGAMGGFLLLAATLTATFAPFLAPYHPEAAYTDYVMGPPSSRFWFGTDMIGHDILSRLLYGSRVSMFVGLSVVLFGCLTGAAVGISSAYAGGKVDLFVQRVVDSVMAFPALILAIAIMAVLGQSLANVIIALAIVQVPHTARTMRSVALSVKETQYVDAARAIGASNLRIMLRHVAINCMAPLLVLASADLGRAIVAEATLSFLGVGVPAYIPTWGSMLGGDAQRYVAIAPWLGIFPGLALSLTVFGINLLGDALRDIWDPRLRGR